MRNKIKRAILLGFLINGKFSSFIQLRNMSYSILCDSSCEINFVFSWYQDKLKGNNMNSGNLTERIFMLGFQFHKTVILSYCFLS